VQSGHIKYCCVIGKKLTWRRYIIQQEGALAALIEVENQFRRSACQSFWRHTHGEKASASPSELTDDIDELRAV